LLTGDRTAGVDFLCESADFQCMSSRHDEDAVAVGYDYIAGKDSNACAVDGEVVGFCDESSQADAAGAVSVSAVDGDSFGLDDFVGVTGAGVGFLLNLLCMTHRENRMTMLPSSRPLFWPEQRRLRTIRPTMNCWGKPTGLL